MSKHTPDCASLQSERNYFQTQFREASDVCEKLRAALVRSERQCESLSELLEAMQNLARVYGPMSTRMRIGSERRDLWDAAFRAMSKAECKPPYPAIPGAEG